MAKVQLSFETIIAKEKFDRYLSREKKAGAPWTKDIGFVVEKYLTFVYHITPIPEFSMRLKEAHNEHYSSRNIILPLNVVDTIVSSCSMWFPYLNSIEDYYNLVCQEILSMVRIHVSVIAGRNIEEIYGITLKKPAPYTRVTIVKNNGSFQLIR